MPRGISPRVREGEVEQRSVVGDGYAGAEQAGAGLWILSTQLIAFWIGGYVCARLRARQREVEVNEHETDVRDGLHGVIVWGVGVLAAGLIGALVLGGATTAAETAEAVETKQTAPSGEKSSIRPVYQDETATE